ncbi:glycosyltransferase family 4 protein [Siminovitchia sediminis]|uniref:Glycosyltransferase family 4 protein n=1 Tax=Siminovitchia sediminis TaxID=1274353 RepID=A0ABW4KJ05_9BACI
MKICHLTSVHHYNDTRIFIKECKSLAEAGYEVHLIAPDAPNVIKEGVCIHGVKKESGSRLKRMTKTVKRVLEKGLELDADVYHFHDPELLPIALKLKKIGKKVIYDVHEDVPKQILTKKWLPKVFHKIVANTFEKYENYAALNFDYIITSTPYIRDRFLKLGCNVKDIKNYPILKELENVDKTWLKKKNSVCYVGGITVARGIKQIIEAIQIANNVKLLLAGNFAYSTEKEMVKSLPGWSKVQELGYLSRAEVKEVYSNSIAGIVVLHPTSNYLMSLPIKMFEYMSAGIPVIASNFPLWKNIIEKYECGICVDPLNPKELGNAIQWIKDNPQMAEEMGKNGRRAIERKYNWEIESQELVKIYKKLLGNY